MNARPHKRAQSNGLKPPTAHARSSRPSLSNKRNASFNHAGTASPSANLRRQKSGTEIAKQRDSDSEDMAASFLQFCCRRRDSTTCTPLPPHSPPMSPTTHAYHDHDPVDILPQMSPTVVRPLSKTFSELNLARISSQSSTSSDHQEHDHYYEHDYDFKTESLDSHVQDLPGYPTSTTLTPCRPSTKRVSTSTDLPSLVHSPSSSYGTTASHYRHTTATRSSTTRSIDLVTPITAPPSPTLIGQQDASLKSQASTLTTLRVAECDTTGEGRRPIIEKDSRRDSAQAPIGAAAGSLRQLFNHDAIRCASRRRSREHS